MLQEDAKSIFLYFEAAGRHLSVWQRAEELEVEAQIYQHALLHFYTSAWVTTGLEC